MPGSSLLEQARRQAKGQSAERNDWNEVIVGEKIYTMEYPLSNDGNLNKNILKIDEITISPALYVMNSQSLSFLIC
jgi:hypothetical protein